MPRSTRKQAERIEDLVLIATDAAVKTIASSVLSALTSGAPVQSGLLSAAFTVTKDPRDRVPYQSRRGAVSEAESKQTANIAAYIDPAPTSRPQMLRVTSTASYQPAREAANSFATDLIEQGLRDGTKAASIEVLRIAARRR